MRADRRARSRPSALASLACIAAAAALLAGSASAQSTDEDVAEPPVLDEVRLIAQRAALPFLVGEKPFILRESAWSGEIAPGKARLIQVQLFKRNDYHFWLAVPDRAAVVGLHLYDGKGNLLEAEAHRYDSPNVTSISASPGETGVYYLRVFLAEETVATPQRWTVVYGYR
jgi:hypothetical protein